MQGIKTFKDLEFKSYPSAALKRIDAFISFDNGFNMSVTRCFYDKFCSDCGAIAETLTPCAECGTFDKAVAKPYEVGIWDGISCFYRHHNEAEITQIMKQIQEYEPFKIWNYLYNAIIKLWKHIKYNQRL